MLCSIFSSSQELNLVGNSIRAEGYKCVKHLPAWRLIVSLPVEGAVDAEVERKLVRHLRTVGYIVHRQKPDLAASRMYWKGRVADIEHKRVRLTNSAHK